MRHLQIALFLSIATTSAFAQAWAIEVGAGKLYWQRQLEQASSDAALAVSTNRQIGKHFAAELFVLRATTSFSGLHASTQTVEPVIAILSGKGMIRLGRFRPIAFVGAATLSSADGPVRSGNAWVLGLGTEYDLTDRVFVSFAARYFDWYTTNRGGAGFPQSLLSAGLGARF